MELSSSFIQQLPIELLCSTVHRLDIVGLRKLLVTYPGSREDILSCLRFFPSLGDDTKSSNEFLAFLADTSLVSTFRPSYFGTVRNEDRTTSEIHVPTITALHRLATHVREDLVIHLSMFGDLTELEDEIDETLYGLGDFLTARGLLYPKRLCGVHFEFRSSDPSGPSGSLIIRFQDGALFVSTGDSDITLPSPLVFAIERLPVTDVMAYMHRIDDEESRDALVLALYRKNVTTFRMTEGTFSTFLLKDIFTIQRRFRVPHTIKTLVFPRGDRSSLTYFLQTPESLHFPNIENVQNVTFISNNEWKILLSRLPDLRSLTYFSYTSYNREILQNHPSLLITRLPIIPSEERKPIVAYQPIQLHRG